MQVDLDDFDLEEIGYSSISHFETSEGLKIDGEWGKDNDEAYNGVIARRRVQSWDALIANATDVHKRLVDLALAIDRGVVEIKAALSYWDGRSRKSPKTARTQATATVNQIDVALAYLDRNTWIIQYADWVEPWANWLECLRATLLSDEWTSKE